MTRNHRLTLLTAGLAFALSGAASAQAEPPTEDPMMGQTPAAETSFEQLDKDSDGFVAKTDVPTGHELSQQFAQADLDGDARLSRAEFDAFSNPVEEEEAEE